jgi:hypothetical protein
MAKPQPVSGTLKRKLDDGDFETIEFTAEEVRSAPDWLSADELPDLVVLYDDGGTRRPFRFVDHDVSVKSIVNPNTGTRTVSF